MLRATKTVMLNASGSLFGALDFVSIHRGMHNPFFRASKNVMRAHSSKVSERIKELGHTREELLSRIVTTYFDWCLGCHL